MEQGVRKSGGGAWRVSSCGFLTFNLLTAVREEHGWMVFGFPPPHQSNKFPAPIGEAIWVWKEGERSSQY